MKVTSTSVVVSAATVAFLGAAFAQDAPMQGQDMGSAMELPEPCQAGEPRSMPGMEGMRSGMDGMGEHQRANMQAMMSMQDLMMQGMMDDDPDVAFACAMIPHHQAAISMAEVELQYGDAEQMKEMAQEIIDAQQREIAELTQWLEEGGQ